MTITLTENNFQTILQSKPTVLIEFTSDFCGPCQMMTHSLYKLEKDYEDILVAEAKSMDHTEWMEAFNILSTPTTLLFYQGKYISRISGAHPQTTIEKWISEAMT